MFTIKNENVPTLIQTNRNEIVVNPNEFIESKQLKSVLVTTIISERPTILMLRNVWSQIGWRRITWVSIGVKIIFVDGKTKK
jgi:hypothetical protein